uniref:Uncharacterized protein n=1 Tax=Streptomyces sp. CS684 TaxID=272618 RepID=I3WY35_9ACTN|nr:hypothetical protein [Streptomyces sp. CS684]
MLTMMAGISGSAGARVWWPLWQDARAGRAAVTARQRVAPKCVRGSPWRRGRSGRRLPGPCCRETEALGGVRRFTCPAGMFRCAAGCPDALVMPLGREAGVRSDGALRRPVVYSGRPLTDIRRRGPRIRVSGRRGGSTDVQQR